MAGAKSSKEALTLLGDGMEEILSRLERAGVQGGIGLKLNEKRDSNYWLSQPGAPKPKLANEKPGPVAIPYDESIASWQQ